MPLSYGALRELRVLLDPQGVVMKVLNGRYPADRLQKFWEELCKILEPRETTRKTIRRATTTKAKREETSSIRAEVMARGEGRCEGNFVAHGPPGVVALEMDHFWGRAKERQTVENCWALCRFCHHEKTNNHPNRRHWLKRFQAHCAKYSYESQVARCAQALDTLDMLDRIESTWRRKAK